ncbi:MULTISPECIES: sensor histidine kinase [unclassified Enterococcus]|jgi:two-component system sensor histidine kinase CiaH|uniref:sensor histidine kinase n=1 Tax=unclassified Enterococcus TaxID=2608891 RepID=UPI003D2A1771
MDEITRKQRGRFFAANVTAFAIIFFLLSLIILQLLDQTAYQQTDLSLNRISSDSRTVQLEINRYKQGDPFLRLDPNTENNRPLAEPENDRFNTQVILWSSSGEILNKEALGGRFDQLEELTLDKDNLDTIQMINLNSQEDTTPLSFRSITAKAPENDQEIAYVQVVANVNQVKASMETFQSILIGCMIVFWLISIGISYYLSNLNMRPIIVSWRKQKEFVENASHELRTPLTIIQNSLEHLFTKPDHTIIEESESIAQALTETRRLTGLTSDLLTLARDSAQQVLTKTEIEPQIFIKQLARPFQEMAELDGKTFILSLEGNAKVVIDEKRIHQVLVILLDNALKYTQTGDSIQLSSHVTPKEWQINVSNSGPSISDEEKPKIFDRFYREDQSRSKETGGYGLGLAIAKQLIEQHKGQITVKDHLPKGVDFQIRLPLK